MFGFIPLILLTVPVVLVVAAGSLIRKRGNPDKVEQHIFRFLVWTSVGLLTAFFVSDWLTSGLGFGPATFLLPTTAGTVALVFLNLPRWRSLRNGEKAAILSILLLLTLLSILQFEARSARGDSSQIEIAFFSLVIFSISILLTIAWTVGKRHPVLLAGTALFWLALFNGLEWGALPLPPESLPGWQSVVSVTAYLALPPLVIATTAMLISTALQSGSLSGIAYWRPIAGRLALIIILLGALTYMLVWVGIWDATDDGIRSLAIMVASSLAAVAAGMVVSLTSPGWPGWIGAISVIVVVASISWLGFVLGNHSSSYQITETRAVRIQTALESFREKTGSYPPDLTALVPGQLWLIPRPIILRDQGWCYQGGPDYYRLGAIYREHWSSPILSVRLYASAGNPPEESWVCDEKLAQLRAQFAAEYNTAPSPAPLPTSSVSTQRIAVQPVLQANSLAIGTWSPNGQYLSFGSTSYYGELGDQGELDLYFLDAQTGKICPASKPKWTLGFRSGGLREHHAWLPDGRLLYDSDTGEMVLLTPCADGVEELADRYPVPFMQVLAFDVQSGQILMKSQDSYWLINGTSLEAQEIHGIPTSPTDIYWGWYAWSADGERLAMSLMSGPEENDEASLYIIDGATGKVENNLPLEGASDAHLPIVDWLTSEELLLQSNTLTILDLRSDPPRTTDLLRDVILLDITYPDDISSMDFIANSDGDGFHIGVWVNHPHNQAIYLYSSETGKVNVFQHDNFSLFFFPGDQLLRLSKWEDTPIYSDEFELVWMDHPSDTYRLTIEGHTPRDYPQLFPKYLPTRSQLVFSSSQGVSLVSIPDGKLLSFWDLAGGGSSVNTVYPSPDDGALVIAADGDGLYYISMPNAR